MTIIKTFLVIHYSKQLLLKATNIKTTIITRMGKLKLQRFDLCDDIYYNYTGDHAVDLSNGVF